MNRGMVSALLISLNLNLAYGEMKAVWISKTGDVSLLFAERSEDGKDSASSWPAVLIVYANGKENPFISEKFTVRDGSANSLKVIPDPSRKYIAILDRMSRGAIAIYLVNLNDGTILTAEKEHLLGDDPKAVAVDSRSLQKMWFADDWDWKQGRLDGSIVVAQGGYMRISLSLKATGDSASLVVEEKFRERLELRELPSFKQEQ